MFPLELIPKISQIGMMPILYLGVSSYFGSLTCGSASSIAGHPGRSGKSGWSAAARTGQQHFRRQTSALAPKRFEHGEIQTPPERPVCRKLSEISPALNSPEDITDTASALRQLQPGPRQHVPGIVFIEKPLPVAAEQADQRRTCSISGKTYSIVGLVKVPPPRLPMMIPFSANCVSRSGTRQR